LKPISGDYVESLLLHQGRSTVDILARSLSDILLHGAPVIDKTGLKGPYEYQFEPTAAVLAGPRTTEGGRGGPVSLAERSENVSASLEEQLGLRLQPEKAVSVEVLVIDSVERPSPN
jgi:uncharacterized protein (TIGR03435 family)